MPAESSPTRSQRRLAEELADDGVHIPGDPSFQLLVLEELDHCRRPPVFEGRQATYGAMVVPTALSNVKPAAMLDQFGCDIVPLDGDPSRIRAYADGRSTYLVRDIHGDVALACFDRSMLFEADLVHLQEVTGAAFVQRTPVLDVVRVAADGVVIAWDGRNWNARPTATSLRRQLAAAIPEHDGRLTDILELAIHWLAPSRIGATILVGGGQLDPGSLDLSTAAHTPALSVSNRRHYAALAAVLRQHDLAVVVDADGVIRKVAVGLRWSSEAENAVDNDRGMRHRSAQRYSYDQAAAIVVVVSEDGPVTVYRHGDVAVTTRLAAATGPTSATG